MVVQSNVKVLQWKKLWQLLSGIHYATPTSTVSDELKSVKMELLNGVKTIEKPIDDNVKLTNCPESLLPFIGKLKTFLDCSKDETWNIFCCYLQNEYNDSIESLMNYLKTETNSSILLNSIWEYQSLERMTLLKVLRNLLEFHKSQSHPFANEYNAILKDIGLSNLRKSYIEQFEQLVKEQRPIKYSHGDPFNVYVKLTTWTERKMREINEILQILLLIVEWNNISVNEFKQLVDLFRAHSFGRQQSYLDMSNSNHKDLVAKIVYSEIALFMKCIVANVIESADVNWISSVISSMDKEIVLLHQQPEHGSLLFTWMIMNFHVIDLNDENEEYRKYRQFGAKATQLGVFNFFHSMVTHPMYRDQNLVTCIVYREIYDQLSFLCDVFDCERIILQNKNIYELLSELLKVPAIAKDFSSGKEGGARALYLAAIDNFPIQFEPLAMIACSLSSTGASFNRQVCEKLENLPTYVEMYDSDRMLLKPSELIENEFVLTHAFNPFGMRIDYTIPAGTAATVLDKANGTEVHFKASFNFFNALHHDINELLFGLVRRPEIDELKKYRISEGLKFLAAVVRRIRNPTDIPSELVHPTELVFDILLKFKDVPNPPITLLAQCFEVCNSLVPMLQIEIYKRVINLDILPFCTTNNFQYRECANGSNFDTGHVGLYLVSFEKSLGRYEFLSAYLTFLKGFVETELDETVPAELAGLIFLLREVFPYINTWRFENEQERLRITSQILQYFCDVLQIPDENKQRKIIRDTCIYSLLNLESGMTLLRIVAVGNGHIEAIMQNESNWMSSENTSFNHLVRLSMTVLLHILRLRNRVANDKVESGLSPLEHVIYSQPKHVIPVVTSYMRNIFNRRLPILSCLLLKRFAIEFQMSLLACLDMESSQIRSTFLERLENELESDQLKVAVLEFVEACIEKQPGLTEAFFKISYNDSEKDSTKKLTTTRKKDLSEGILTFMNLYLKVVGDNPNAISDNNEEGKLLCQIMSLFHSLWKNNMQTLIGKLLDEKNFWRSVLNPLFGHIQPSLRIYSQLFNMIGLELYRIVDPKNIDAGFKETLDKFLTKNYFIDWIDNILEIPAIVDVITDETPEWLCRLQSFKDLFVIILRRERRHGIQVPEQCLEYCTKRCLNKLTERVHFAADYRPFIVLAELYSTLLLSRVHKYNSSVADDIEVFRKISELVHELAAAYGEMHVRAKESILAIAFKAIELFGDKINAIENIDFIESIVLIVCEELRRTELFYKCKSNDANEPRNLPFILSFSILRSIVNQCHDHSNLEHLLMSNRVFQRILSCLYITLPLYSTRKITCEMLDALNTFAIENYADHLLNCDFGDYLWLKLLPPKELLKSSVAAGVPTPGNIEPTTISTHWMAQDWWPIYRRGIQLVHSMLLQNKHLFIKDAITFVGVHEEFIMDSILLAKHSLSEPAMDLIRSALELVNELILYEKQWRLDHQQSLINLMRCVQAVLDHAVLLLQRPKVLRRLLRDFSPNGQNKSMNNDANNSLNDINDLEQEMEALNSLLRFIIICCNSLLAFSPKLIDQLTAIDFDATKWQPLIEIQFTAPKLNVTTPFPQLTFGTVLNAAVVFTKAMNIQQITFSGIPLNDVRTDGISSNQNLNQNQTTLDNSHIGEQTVRHQSLTAQISTSTTIATNEYLLHLDVDLCHIALEFILTLLASQSLLALKDLHLSQREKQLIKRELCTELFGFHEFVRKRILNDATRDDIRHRKKYGLIPMESIQLSYTPKHDEQRKSSTDSMRVHVTRKLHLSTQPSPSTSGISGRSPITTSTPVVQLKSCLKTSPKHGQKRFSDSFEDRLDNESCIAKKGFSDETFDYDVDYDAQLFYDPEDPTFCETSFVRLVEEDYLHFLSNLFSYIYQSEKV